MSTANYIDERTACKPKVNPWVLGVVVALGAFMEVLDTDIANVALPHIAGNLGATNSQSTWVLTSYLVANAIVLPITGFLAEMFGRKRLFMVCIALFTVSSFFCGIAQSLGMLILFRVLQGAFGGGLQPMAQAILFDSFPPQKHGQAFALFGVTVVIAPAIGPILGGWITDNYNWRWVFYINIPVGLLTLLLVYNLLEDQAHVKSAMKRLANFDYVGFSLLALGVGALQILLDKGQEDDWFGSHFITTLFIIAVLGLVSLAIWEWHHKDPIVDVRLFRNFNFATANVMFLMLGASFFSALVLLPQFLQTLMGYPAQTAGMVLSTGAIVMSIMLVCVGQLSARLQARHMIAFGWMAVAVGMYISTRQTDLHVSFDSSARLRILQCFALPFLFVPLTTAAYVGIPTAKRNNAAGLMNFMRNIGQSIGTAFVTTLVARRAQFHQSMLAEYTNSTRFVAAIDGLAMQLHQAGLSLQEARRQALDRLYGMVQAQATAISYLDVYWVLGVVAIAMFFTSFLLAKNEPKPGGRISLH
jgi:DHA2 family multidrug resistance protein